MIWTRSLNTPRRKVIPCPTGHIRATAVKLPSLTRPKDMRSNSSSGVRGNISTKRILRWQGTCSASTCAGRHFVGNFPPMIWRNRISFLCALILASSLSGWAQDTVDSDIVRPSGVNGPVRKAKAVTQKRADDDSESDAPKAKKSKSSHARAHRARAKSNEESDTIAAPTEFTPEGIPKTSAASVIVVDANSGRILYEKNADQVRQAASTQKLLTALIVAETGFLDRPVTVQSVDTMCDPVKLGIKSGETYQRIDLLRALLVKSPNDVAKCLARDNAGSVEAFAERMNQKARELGATHSHFVNPNGLPIPGQYSTARDLSLIAKAAYANPTIRSIVCMPQYVFRFANGRTRELENTNKLLRRLAFCNGMKTGYTEAAGHCLISSATRPGRDVIAVVLGDSKGGIWRDSAALLSWALWQG